MIKTIVRSTLVIALVGAILGFTSAARAEETKAEKAKDHEATGKIESVDAKAGIITIKHKKETQTFTLAEDVKFGHEGDSVKMTITDLKVGDKIKIHYTEDGGKLVAHKVGRVEMKEDKKDK